MCINKTFRQLTHSYNKTHNKIQRESNIKIKKYHFLINSWKLNFPIFKSTKIPMQHLDLILKLNSIQKALLSDIHLLIFHLKKILKLKMKEKPFQK